MKFLKILGMVVALHVVLFTFFLLSPGCQSNPTTPAPTPAATEPAAPASSLAPTPVTENWSNQAPSAASNPVSSTISSAPVEGVTNVDQMRAAPSRPDRPETYISTGNTEPAALNPPPTTHVIRSGDTLAKVAAKYGTTTSAIQKANPGVKPQSLRVGQIIKLPAGINSGTPAAAAPGVSAAMTGGARYTVRSGDSLSAIAARNGTTVTALRQANNIRGDNIQVGQELIIPGGVSSPAPASGYTPTPSAATAPSTSRISGDASSTTFRHVIKSGETLGVIAKRYSVTVQEIMAANKIADARKVRAGQELVIPGYSGTGAAPAPTSTVRTTTPPPTASPAATVPETTPAPIATETLPEPEPLIPADMTDAPPIPVDEPVPTP